MLETLGQYKILDWLGEGRLGEVCRARDTRLGRTVAIKVLPAELAADPERREAFLRDARAASRLSHPNIAALYEIGEEAGHDFLVFEFVSGETLKTVIAGRPLNPRRAVDLAVQLADALAEAHAQGIVQRDIGTDNVIVTPRGSAKILDVGLAAWAPGATPYMSPEQLGGGDHNEIDERTDVFSLGVMLFEMLTGRLPWAGATPAAVAQQVVEAPAAAPSSVNRSLPRELDAVVAKALAKDADKRYQAATLAADLRSIGAMLDARSAAAEPMTLAPVARRRHRTRAVAVSALTAVCVLLALLLVWLAVERGWIR
jgi:serine/threonine protein kinase